jgi:hypothetical protein
MTQDNWSGNRGFLNNNPCIKPYRLHICNIGERHQKTKRSVRHQYHLLSGVFLCRDQPAIGVRHAGASAARASNGLNDPRTDAR